MFVSLHVGLTLTERLSEKMYVQTVSTYFYCFKLNSNNRDNCISLLDKHVKENGHVKHITSEED